MHIKFFQVSIAVFASQLFKIGKVERAQMVYFFRKLFGSAIVPNIVNSDTNVYIVCITLKWKTVIAKPINTRDKPKSSMPNRLKEAITLQYAFS